MITIGSAQLSVHDQPAALDFYTRKLGTEVRSDVTLPEMGDFRWLTVGPATQQDMTLVLMAIPRPPVMGNDTADEVRNLNGQGLRRNDLPTPTTARPRLLRRVISAWRRWEAGDVNVEPSLETEAALLPVLAELREREPIFHRLELGVGKEDLRQTTPGFWEIGAVLVVGEGGEGLLGVAVPAHRPLWVPPAALHGVAGRLVARVADRLLALEVTVLGLDDVVGALPAVLEVTGPPEGTASHGFHVPSPSDVVS